MGLLDNIRMALSSLWSNKLRSLLTMLGIIIGIGAVIAIVTVGQSLTGSISDSMQSLGVSNVTVSLTSKSDSTGTGTGAVSIRMFGMEQPEDEDLITDEMLAEYRAAFADAIASISLSEALGSGTAAYGTASGNIMATGVNPEYPASEGLSVTSGRFITDNDSDKHKKVCVIADALAETLFGTGADPIGQKLDLTINNRSYTFYIAGVYHYEEDGTVNLFSSEAIYPLYIPLGTAKQLNSSANGYQSFTVVGSNPANNESFISNTESFFASYYTRNQSWTVTASSLESMMNTMTEMLSTVSIAIAAIAAISLLVGGIGVMNIMMVSITERTREIGTRKALGAPGYALRLQFITEAVVICLIGGLIGVAVGISLGAVGASLLGYAARPSIAAIILAVGFSMVIGVFFGYYPAGKAAKLDPIDALRYE